MKTKWVTRQGEGARGVCVCVCVSMFRSLLLCASAKWHSTFQVHALDRDLNGSVWKLCLLPSDLLVQLSWSQQTMLLRGHSCLWTNNMYEGLLQRFLLSFIFLRNFFEGHWFVAITKKTCWLHTLLTGNWWIVSDVWLVRDLSWVTECECYLSMLCSRDKLHFHWWIYWFISLFVSCLEWHWVVEWVYVRNWDWTSNFWPNLEGIWCTCQLLHWHSLALIWFLILSTVLILPHKCFTMLSEVWPSDRKNVWQPQEIILRVVTCLFLMFLKQKCPHMITKTMHEMFVPTLIVINCLALKFVSFILTSYCVHTLHFTSERQNTKACNCSKYTKFPSFLIVEHALKKRNFCRRPSYMTGPKPNSRSHEHRGARKVWKSIGPSVAATWRKEKSRISLQGGTPWEPGKLVVLDPLSIVFTRKAKVQPLCWRGQKSPVRCFPTPSASTLSEHERERPNDWALVLMTRTHRNVFCNVQKVPSRWQRQKKRIFLWRKSKQICTSRMQLQTCSFALKTNTRSFKQECLAIYIFVVLRGYGTIQVCMGQLQMSFRYLLLCRHLSQCPCRVVRSRPVYS